MKRFEKRWFDISETLLNDRKRYVGKHDSKQSIEMYLKNWNVDVSRREFGLPGQIIKETG